jgi:hypothetical protein
MARAADDYKLRKEWVHHLKKFLLDLEKTNPDAVLVKNGSEFHFVMNLINEAIAGDSHECFFAGWPSTLVKSGSRKRCQNPINGNSNYQSGDCKASELQCQPLLFGKNLCVSFSRKKDRQMAFASCNKKSKQMGGSDFSKTLNSDEKAELKEISILAHQVCVTGEKGI